MYSTILTSTCMLSQSRPERSPAFVLPACMLECFRTDVQEHQWYRLRAAARFLAVEEVNPLWKESLGCIWRRWGARVRKKDREGEEGGGEVAGMSPTTCDVDKQSCQRVVNVQEIGQAHPPAHKEMFIHSILKRKVKIEKDDEIHPWVCHRDT